MIKYLVKSFDSKPGPTPLPALALGLAGLVGGLWFGSYTAGRPDADGRTQAHNSMVYHHTVSVFLLSG